MGPLKDFQEPQRFSEHNLIHADIYSNSNQEEIKDMTECHHLSKVSSVKMFY